MLETESPSKAFLGVRFVLFGFDSSNEHNVRSKLIDAGGVDLGQYSQHSTHVIVDKIVYDDPVCVAARNDGKTLVTALWVDHSFEIGMPVDATSVMYRPPKDLNGIPGAKNLIICLTGYQRQDRDDIMTMVGLMGAQFSKPLVANKVTHLICYKFEGEKYELAKKMKKIKLVNHRWLEDCLRDWELLPEANYNKSGYELEMMEAEAKDSEEEAEDATTQSRERNMNKSPLNVKIGISNAGELAEAEVEMMALQPNSNMTEHPLKPLIAKDILTPVKDVNMLPQHGYLEAGAFGNASAHICDPCDQNKKSKKVENDLASTSGSAESPPSGFKSSAISYSRKTSGKSMVSMFTKELPGKLGSSVKANINDFKMTDVFDSSSEIECSKGRLDSGHLETPCKDGDSRIGDGSTSILPQKRVTPVSAARSKSRKVGHNSEASITGSPLVSCKTQGTEPDVHEKNFNLPHGNEGGKDNAPLHNSCAGISTTKCPSLSKKLLTDMSAPCTVTSEAVQNKIADENAPHISFMGLTESMLSREPKNDNFGISGSMDVGGEAEPQNQQQDMGISSLSNRKLVTNESALAVDLLQGNDKLVAKPLKKKMVAKKTLGSKAKMNNVANQKGSVYSSKIAANNDSATCLSGEKVTAVHENANEVQVSPQTFCVEVVKETAVTISSAIEAVNKNESMLDDTEPPEEKDELGLENPINQEKSGVVELAHTADTDIGMKSGVQQVTNDCKARIHDDAMAGRDDTSGVKLKKAVPGKKFGLCKSTLKADLVKGKSNKEKIPISTAMAETVPTVKEMIQSKKDSNRQETHCGKNTKKEKKKEKNMLCPVGKINDTVSVSVDGNSMEVEKENKPVLVGGQNSSIEEPLAGNGLTKSSLTPMKINKKSKEIKFKSMPEENVMNKVKAEPVWFILSGHRLQRKEFQQVIRRLKGRCCRDSHQWSYQATHFITPVPRRTEKLFAAAASGRWILKSDYLSASSEAGSFLPEEPFEWHKKGLSEDGAINLEAPRKWRLLREKTGHGAFYGMQIIVYGECIAPPMDTLKRVVKAGDGTILATCPPYTRFLKSGIDFAVISPGMPHVDIWIQEFLKHEIPCVVADYLVEYVCKPGYPLERHVLYNTHDWAVKSFSNLQRRAEEVAEDLTSPDDSDSNDVCCQVCRSRDRGEVMLICGDESGSLGCGVGIHIDCCDPPLQDVPEGDWFCPKCSES